jgi:hypothetical protein
MVRQMPVRKYHLRTSRTFKVGLSLSSHLRPGHVTLTTRLFTCRISQLASCRRLVIAHQLRAEYISVNELWSCYI